MHHVRTRMPGLHDLLTGGTGHPAWRCAYPPRCVWGDFGPTERKSRSPRRSLRASLRWGYGP